MVNDIFNLSKRGAELVEQLRDEAIEVEAICMQAPNIWDAETNTDTRIAKEGCNGRPKTLDSEGTPPCPLRFLCIETALEIKPVAGVWGGMTIFELRRLDKKRQQAELRKYLGLRP